MQKRRPLPPRDDSDSEESEGPVLGASSDTEEGSDEDEVVPLARRRGRREEDEGEEGGPPSEEGSSEGEEDDEEEEYGSSEEDEEEEEEGEEDYESADEGQEGQAEGDRSRAATSRPVATRGRGAALRAQARETRTAVAKRGAAKKLVYRPKNAPSVAPSVEGAREVGGSDAVTQAPGDAGPVPKGQMRSRPARADRRDSRGSVEPQEDAEEGGEGDEEETTAAGGRGRGRGRGKVDPNDPQFVPRGRFFMHDDRFGGRGGPNQRTRPEDSYDPDQEQIWTHDGFERLEREEREGRVTHTDFAVAHARENDIQLTLPMTPFGHPDEEK